jgi:hypothetical protein
MRVSDLLYCARLHCTVLYHALVHLGLLETTFCFKNQPFHRKIPVRARLSYDTRRSMLAHQIGSCNLGIIYKV